MAPLTKLLCKDAFHWVSESQTAFEKLKTTMTAAPVLALLNFVIPFALETSASSTVMGPVLHQQGHPIAYFSKPFCFHLQQAYAYVMELHAIVAAVCKCRKYLLGHKFTIFTDHCSLRELMSQIIQTPKQQFYLAKLQGYDYDIQYKTRVSNTVVDSLLHRDTSPPSHYFVLLIPHLDFMTQLNGTLLASSEFQKQREAILSHPEAYPSFSISDDLIIFKGTIWLDSQNPFIPTLLHEYHVTPLGGHFGVKKTLHRLCHNFQWVNMIKDIKAFVHRCNVCQQIKHITRKNAGLLQPILIPTGVWEDLSMDFVTQHPSSHGFTVVLILVDRFSKGVHLGALSTQFTAFKVANLFMDTVCKLHGFPRSIISDRDPIFISSFWRELFKMSGTTLRMSTAYHP